MLTNAEMKPGRFARWARARKMASAIVAHLNAGGVVIVATYTKATQLRSKHAGMIKATRSGCYLQRGKNWDCIDGCAIRFH